MGLKQTVKRLLPEAVVNAYRRREVEAALSQSAKAQRSADARGLKDEACSAQEAVHLTAQWLCRAQDNATPTDGGVARHFSLNSGWSPSYPETTGYIVPTFIALASEPNGQEYAERARRMLDWLVSIQLPSGAYQGGMISDDPVPVTFNTGQILIGLAAGAGAFETEHYRAAMMKAATWLKDTQDDDGCWRKFGTPFAGPGEKTYETHVSWGLLEAERIAPGHGFGASGLAQIRWATGNVQANGWIRDCCLSDPTRPLTHTLGYALRGIIEGYRYSQDQQLLAAAKTIGEGLRRCVQDDGFLPGRLDSNFRAAAKFACLTGSAQIAACFFDLYRWTRDESYCESARRLVSFVRRTMIVHGESGNIGAVAGSFPIDGSYGAFEYLNWAAKFFIDAQLMAIDSQDDSSQHP